LNGDGAGLVLFEVFEHDGNPLRVTRTRAGRQQRAEDSSPRLQRIGQSGHRVQRHNIVAGSLFLLLFPATIFILLLDNKFIGIMSTEKCDSITNIFEMDPEKAEFKRLIELMGWSQTEAARRLRKTPSAINHLVNPDHPNKPTQTMMQLLKLIIASERPDLINAQTYELKETAQGAKPAVPQLSARERELIEGLKQLPPEEQERVYGVIEVLLRSTARKGGKRRK
jgi:plasmid maintenance system antidote protein VapI